MRNALILGVPSCGTASLKAYLESRKQWNEVQCLPYLFYMEDGPWILKESFNDEDYFVILRDPIERVYVSYQSRYKYFRHRQPFEDYLRTGFKESNMTMLSGYYEMGELDLIRQSNYEHYMRIWKGCPINYVWLETLYRFAENPPFPHLNKMTAEPNDKDTKIISKLLTLEKERVKDIDLYASFRHY